MKLKKKLLIIFLFCLGLGLLCFNIAYSDSGWDSNYGGYSGGYSGGSSGGYSSSGGGFFSTGNAFFDFIMAAVILIIGFISCIICIIKFKQGEKNKELIHKKYKAMEQIKSDDLEENKRIDDLRNKAITTYKLFVENINNKNKLLDICSENMINSLNLDNTTKEHIIENLNILEFNITNIDDDKHLITCYLTISCNDYYYDKEKNTYSG